MRGILRRSCPGAHPLFARPPRNPLRGPKFTKSEDRLCRVRGGALLHPSSAFPGAAEWHKHAGLSVPIRRWRDPSWYACRVRLRNETVVQSASAAGPPYYDPPSDPRRILFVRPPMPRCESPFLPRQQDKLNGQNEPTQQEQDTDRAQEQG